MRQQRRKGMENREADMEPLCTQNGAAQSRISAGSGGAPGLGQHDFVALRVAAHREMGGLLRGVLGFAEDGAAGGAQGIARCEEIGDLKAEAGPGRFAFAAAMDPNDRPCYGDFRHDVGLPDDLRVEDCAVETEGPREIGGPDDVFEFLYVHGVFFAGRAVALQAQGYSLFLFAIEKFASDDRPSGQERLE